MKRFAACILAFFMIFLCACGTKSTAPQKHTIPYPDNYPTHTDEYGADAFDSRLDSPTGKYFTVNDYYNMKSGSSLHILEKFDTYQQSTEYTCGNSCALMVLHRFGIDDYDEMQLADIMQTDNTHGTTVENMRDFFAGLGWAVEYNASTDLYFDSPDAFAEYAVSRIDSGIPVMVDWSDWAGHWQVLIGIDTVNPDLPYDDVLIFADPYDVTDHYQDGYYIYPLGRFFYQWYEGPCTANTERYQQPFVSVCPAA